MGGGWRGGGERRWKEAVLRGAEAQETHCGRRHERVQVKSCHTAQLGPHRPLKSKERPSEAIKGGNISSLYRGGLL